LYSYKKASSWDFTQPSLDHWFKLCVQIKGVLPAVFTGPRAHTGCRETGWYKSDDFQCYA